MPLSKKLQTRTDVSGTADTFGSYIGLPYGAIETCADGTNIIGKGSNGDVVAYIKGATAADHRMGFTDFDYVMGDSALTVIPWAGFPGSGATPTFYKEADVKDGYTNSGSTHFPHGATRGWYLLTNGAPTPVEKDFITFVQAPGVKPLFNAYNAVHVSELVTM